MIIFQPLLANIIPPQTRLHYHHNHCIQSRYIDHARNFEKNRYIDLNFMIIIVEIHISTTRYKRDWRLIFTLQETATQL